MKKMNLTLKLFTITCIQVVQTQFADENILSENALTDEIQTNLLKIKALKSCLNGTTIRVTSVTRLPFQELSVDSNGSYKGKGFSFQILEELRDFFQFRFDIIVPEDDAFGKRENWNGTEKWNGMIGLLLENKADIAMGLFTVTEDRIKVVDFSRNIYEDSIGVLIKRTETSNHANALLAPFTKEVWILVVGISVVMGPFLFLLLKVQSRIVRGNSTDHLEFTLIECIWFVFSGLVKQGSHLKPHFDSTRIFLATWWIFTMIVTAFYTANLTAYLTTSNYIIISHIREIVDNDQLKWLVKSNGALDAAIEMNKENEFLLLKSSMNKKYGSRIENVENVEKMVLSGKYVFLHEIISLNYMVVENFKETQNCELTVGQFSFFPRPYAFAYRKGFQHASLFDNYLTLLQTTGLLERAKSTYFPIFEPCSVKSATFFQTNEHALDVTSFMSAFRVYGYGLIAGLAFLIVERMWTRERKCRQVTEEETNGDVRMSVYVIK